MTKRLAGAAILGSALLAIALAPSALHAVTATVVQVVNSTAQWIPVIDLMNPGRNAVQIQVSHNTSGQGFNFFNIYTVPASKRLVIDTFSAGCSSDFGFDEADLGVVLGPAGQSFPFPPTIAFNGQGPNAFNGNIVQKLTHRTVVYADPNTMVSVAILAYSKPKQTMNCDAAIAGHLVDLNGPEVDRIPPG